MGSTDVLDSATINNLIRPGHHVLVVGLGKSGLAAVKFFLSRGLKVSVSDAAAEARLDPGLRQWLSQNQVFVETGGHSSELFTAVDLIFVSPGVALNMAALAAARRQAVPIAGEMAIIAAYLRTPVVAVTGTNGKTTVTTLLGDIFRAAGKKVFVGGNIGTPVFQYLATQEAEVAVLEVSSYQLDSAGGFCPEVAILLNITPDHLDRYESYAAYAAAKFQIFRAQHDRNLAILNADDPEITRRSDLWPDCRRLFFGNRLAGRPGAEIHGQQVIFAEGALAESYDLAGSGLAEPPNLQNAAAAIMAARAMGCSAADIQKGLTNFVPLPHRLTLVAEIAGVKYFDDSKATNIGAVQAALAAMRQPVVLIAGGRDKGGDYGLLKESIGQKVKFLLLIGEAREKMAQALAALTRTEMVNNLEEAVQRATAIAVPGDAVLLSPACASFDMFENFAQRGEAFAAAVNGRRQAASGRR